MRSIFVTPISWKKLAIGAMLSLTGCTPYGSYLFDEDWVKLLVPANHVVILGGSLFSAYQVEDTLFATNIGEATTFTLETRDRFCQIKPAQVTIWAVCHGNDHPVSIRESGDRRSNWKYVTADGDVLWASCQFSAVQPERGGTCQFPVLVSDRIVAFVFADERSFKSYNRTSREVRNLVGGWQQDDK